MNKKVSGFINQDEIRSYLNDVRKIKVMTPERELELKKIMLSDTLTPSLRMSIKNEMITGNLRLVLSLCKSYIGNGLDFEDLVAEGNVGLSKAFDMFDWSKDVRFSTYSSWWIRASIMESLNTNSRTIRIPTNVVQQLNKFKKEDTDQSEEELNELESFLPKVFSIDLDPSEDQVSLHETLSGGTIDEDTLFETKENLRKDLFSTMSTLSDREKLIIKDYYGLEGEPKTLQHIGEDIGLTKERVRQIKEIALRKIRTESINLFEHRG